MEEILDQLIGSVLLFLAGLIDFRWLTGFQPSTDDWIHQMFAYKT